jgi:hypothetical protein
MKTALMKIFPVVCAATLLADCSVQPDAWKAETISAVQESPKGVVPPPAPSCPPIDPEIPAEAKRVASLDSIRSGGTDALAAALIGSEAHKNARLRQALVAYERCRRSRR